MTELKLRRKVWKFARYMMGKAPDYNGTVGPNPAGAQCVNLCNYWFAVLGVSQFSGNAVDWVGAHTANVKWHEMNGGLRLRHGDVAVFTGAGYSPEGHVAVVMDGSKDPVETLDLNFPEGSRIELREHYRSGMAGCLRPQVTRIR